MQKKYPKPENPPSCGQTSQIYKDITDCGFCKDIDLERTGPMGEYHLGEGVYAHPFAHRLLTESELDDGTVDLRPLDEQYESPIEGLTEFPNEEGYLF
jgi:hypothetical protein